MKLHSLHSLLRSIAVVAIATVAGLFTTSPANASVSQGFISGWDNINDDWGDEGVLARNSFAYSNATGLWQTVLWADGYLGTDDIDCVFGPKTEAATKRWQADHHLGDDGRVGVLTFGRADDKLRYTSDPEIIGYDGNVNDTYFNRIDGRYHLYPTVVAYYRSMSPLC